jgi:8-amino-7-oxononanoate synthase
VRQPDRFEERVRRRLGELEADGLRRSLLPPSGLDFCSNDYLGLATHPLLVKRMAEAVAREGCGSTGSRLLRGQRAVFETVERKFAAFKGTERSLYFSSGYLANLAVLTTFPEAGDLVFSDELNHASLIDGARLSRARRIVFPHGDVAALARMLREEVSAGQKFVVTESLFSMDGDEAPLAGYAALCRECDARLVVDEAHAVGIYGAQGSGLIEARGVEDEVFVSINTAGKALGVAGAFVAGPGWAVEYLVQRARPFIFSTAPPPAVAAALETSLDIVAVESDRREQLAARAAHLRRRLAEAGVPTVGGTSHIVPVMIGDSTRAVAVAGLLRERGFDVRAIRPPSVPDGTARLRVTVTLAHSEAILDRFAAALASALATGTPCLAASS